MPDIPYLNRPEGTAGSISKLTAEDLRAIAAHDADFTTAAGDRRRSRRDATEGSDHRSFGKLPRHL